MTTKFYFFEEVEVTSTDWIKLDFSKDNYRTFVSASVMLFCYSTNANDKVEYKFVDTPDIPAGSITPEFFQGLALDNLHASRIFLRLPPGSTSTGVTVRVAAWA